jgi:hypothetical protein
MASTQALLLCDPQLCVTGWLSMIRHPSEHEREDAVIEYSSQKHAIEFCGYCCTKL